MVRIDILHETSFKTKQEFIHFLEKELETNICEIVGFTTDVHGFDSILLQYP